MPASTLSAHQHPRRTAWLVLLILPFSASLQPAAGQEPMPASGPPEAPTLLPEIQVRGTAERADGPVQGYRATRSSTATRTDTALRGVPQSVSVVPRQLLEDQQAQTLDQALANVSGVRSGGSVGNRAETYLIRGFRTNTRAIDGVLLNPALGFPESFTDLANIERVEVLKGPASVLYGQGDPGGLINLVTRWPQFMPSAGLTLEGGSYGYARSEFDVTGGLDGERGTLAGRLTGSVTRDPGWRRNLRQAEREFVAPSLLWQPDGATRVRLDFSYINSRTPFDRGLVAQGAGVSLPRKASFGESWSRYNVERTALGWQVEHDVTNWLTLRQVTRFDWADSRRISADPTALSANRRTLRRRATDQNDGMQSVDLLQDATARFDTGPLQHNLTAGMEYSHGRRSFTMDRATLASIDVLNPRYGALPGRFSLYQTGRYALDMVSFYAQDQVRWGELTVLGGLRYDTYHQDSERITAGRRVAQGLSGDEVTPRLGAVYALTPRVNLFAGWSRSFLPQTGTDRFGNAFDPETGEQFEAGLKSDLTERLSLTLSGFQIRRCNVLATDPVDSTYSVETGEQRSRGFEAELAGDLGRGWKLYASGAYTDAEITADTTYAVGRRLTGVPLWSGSLWASYEVPEGNRLQGLMLGGGVFAASTRTGDLNNSFRVGGYTRVDLTASYPLREGARLTVTVRNLFDAGYIEAPVSRTESYPGAPRTVLVSLKARI